jgi:hypothetical protein
MKTFNAIRLALAGAAVLAVLNCSERAPLGPPARANLTGSPLGPQGLIRCTPLAAVSVTQTIGPEGGTLSVGAHQLAVPPGALLTPTTITAVAPADTVNEVRFSPEGLVFQLPATLWMSYGNCDLAGNPGPKEIVYATDELNILEHLPSSDDPLSRTVIAPLQHFSVYAVAW